MNSKNTNDTMTVRPLYLIIDNDKEKTQDVTFDKNKVEKCDIIMVTQDDFYSNNPSKKMEELEEKMGKWLRKKYPDFDWEFKVSNKGNFVFWKRSIRLKEQIEFPFDWSRETATENLAA